MKYEDTGTHIVFHPLLSHIVKGNRRVVDIAHNFSSNLIILIFLDFKSGNGEGGKSNEAYHDN